MTRKQWLEDRQSGIGASEAASVVHLNKYDVSAYEKLWEIKTGRREAEDISNNPAVKYGTEAEIHLRNLFALDFPQYKVSYTEYKIIRHLEYPFIFATLDGELEELGTGRKGILEIKTAEPRNALGWADWKDRIPDHYFIQVIHQLLVTGYEFVELKAQLKMTAKNDLKLYTRHYHLEREDYLDKIEWLLEEEIKFWELVQTDQRPKLVLNI